MKKFTSPKNILYGAHTVLAALNNPARKCHEIWIAKGLSPEIEESLKHRPEIQVLYKSLDDFDKLLGEETVHQGIALKVSPLKRQFIEDIINAEATSSCVIILDQVTDPQNVGAIMRSAAAFGASAVVCQSMNAPDLDSPSLAKSASGAVEFIPLIDVTNLSRTMDDLKAAGFWCFGLDEQGTSTIEKTKLSGKVALVMGREGKGLRPLTKESCDVLVTLPTSTAFTTLNVSNAAAVALYEWKRQNG